MVCYGWEKLVTDGTAHHKFGAVVEHDRVIAMTAHPRAEHTLDDALHIDDKSPAHERAPERYLLGYAVGCRGVAIEERGQAGRIDTVGINPIRNKFFPTVTNHLAR